MKRYPLINDYLLYLSQNIHIRKLQIMISWQMSVAEICTRSWSQREAANANTLLHGHTGCREIVVLFYKMPRPADVVIHNLRHFFALLSLAGLHLLFSVTFMKHQPPRLKNEPKKNCSSSHSHLRLFLKVSQSPQFAVFTLFRLYNKFPWVFFFSLITLINFWIFFYWGSPLTFQAPACYKFGVRGPFHNCFNLAPMPLCVYDFSATLKAVQHSLPD